ncbi:MAG TPA: hypothetical protein VFX17_04440 [Patescibacteria group bacterium]|nr:hypothetical protein [Patescibacteria group bacterium]
MNRKILIIIVIILGILAAASLFFLRQKPAVTAGPNITPNTLTKVSDATVISPVVTYDHNAFWYFNSDGHLFREDLDGSNLDEYPLPSDTPNFHQAVWPAAGDSFITMANATADSSRKFYDSSAKKFITYPANVQSFDFLPDGKRIAYIWESTDGKQSQLMVANADLSGYKALSTVFWPDLQIKVSPDGLHALLWRGQIQDTNKIYEADLTTGAFTTIVDAGKNTEAQWIGANKFIYTQISSSGPDLWLYDASASKATDLGLAATLDQTAADATGENLYVDLNDGQADSIYKFDLTTLQKQLVYTFEATMHPHNVFMDGQIICFINSSDGKLYTLTQ